MEQFEAQPNSAMAITAEAGDVVCLTSRLRGRAKQTSYGHGLVRASGVAFGLAKLYQEIADDLNGPNRDIDWNWWPISGCTSVVN
jgi:hypothetical protein